MELKIEVEGHVKAINMPDNLRVGLMVAEQRRTCVGVGCEFDYHAFAFGQSPFPVPGPLVRALAENAVHGHYSAAEGIQEVREAIAGFNRRHFGLDVEPARVFVGPGTKDVIHTLFDVVAGDVVLPSPSWIGYSPQITLLEKRFHVYRLKREHAYRIQPDELDRFLGSLPRVQHTIVFNNPHNPTGVVYGRDELEAIASVCRKHKALVLADEIYALTTYEPDSFTSMGLVYPEGTFVTNGLSKDRSAGGYRFGYCIMPERNSDELEAAFTKVAATVYTNVATPIQLAAVAAYQPSEEIEEYFQATREIHRMMGTFLSRAFNGVPGISATVPQGAFYLFVDFNDLAEDLRRHGVAASNDLAMSLIDHPYHLAVVSGDACLLDEHDFGARVAFVDYDGGSALEDYRSRPPKRAAEEEAFVKRNAPQMAAATEVLREWVDWVVS